MSLFRRRHSRRNLLNWHHDNDPKVKWQWKRIVTQEAPLTLFNVNLSIVLRERNRGYPQCCVARAILRHKVERTMTFNITFTRTDTHMPWEYFHNFSTISDISNRISLEIVHFSFLDHHDIPSFSFQKKTTHLTWTNNCFVMILIGFDLIWICFDFVNMSKTLFPFASEENKLLAFSESC